VRLSTPKALQTVPAPEKEVLAPTQAAAVWAEQVEPQQHAPVAGTHGLGTHEPPDTKTSGATQLAASVRPQTLPVQHDPRVLVAVMRRLTSPRAVLKLATRMR